MHQGSERTVKNQIAGLLGSLIAGLSVLLVPALGADSQVLYGWLLALTLVFALGLMIAFSMAQLPEDAHARATLERVNALHVATEGLLWASFVFVWSGLPTAAERLALLALLGTATAIHLLYREQTPRAALLLVLGALGPSLLWCWLYGSAPERLVAWSLFLALLGGSAWLFGPARARAVQMRAGALAAAQLKRRVTALEQDLVMAQRATADAQQATADAISEAKLLSRNLSTSKAEATRALAAQAAFLANMSHEIRTPMNGILGLSELLAKTTLSHKQQRFLAGITSSGEGLLSLINNMLDLAKAESGKLELASRPFDLAGLLDDVVASFAAAMHRKGVALVAFCDLPSPCHFVGDADRLRQVLSNLIGNAMKFTERGEVRVRVRTETSGRIGFEVVDTGIGIAPEAMERIFDSFTQADASTTRNYGGTGLGLTICRQLVTLMGGRIGVESRVGKGSRFWFELPLAAAPAGALATPDWNPAQLQGRPVLLLADAGGVRDAVAYALRRWGMVLEVFQEPDGLRERLGRWSDHSRRPTLVVDERVAGLPAAVFLRELRAVTQALATPIVVLIGFGNLDETSQWLQPGVQTFVTKPVRQSDLLAALVKGLDATSPENQPVPSPQSGLQPGARVLVVEDNPINLELAVLMLESLGCKCETATDGEAALARLCQPQVGLDLVLLDCQMPKLDGYAVARGLREYERRQRLPRPLAVIALTANALAGDRELCLSAGMDDYLSKPFTQGQLLEALERWLPPVPAASPVADPSPAPTSTAASSDPWMSDLAGETSLDAGILKEIFALEASGRPGLFERLVTVFRNNATERLSDMRRALHEQDAHALNRGAHAFKSAAAQLGAQALAASCRNLEEATQGGEWQNVAPLFELCELEFRAASSLLLRVAQMRRQAA